MSHGELPGAVLSGSEIRRLIAATPPLVTGLLDLELQLQPNGIDLTLESVWRCVGSATLGITDEERVLPARGEVGADASEYFDLEPGPYVIRLREKVALPLDLMAFGRSRSSLLRSGVALHTAVWDAGYRGRSEALLVVYNPSGFRVRRDARVLQLVFCRLQEPTTGYRGRYQDENLRPEDEAHRTDR